LDSFLKFIPQNKKREEEKLILKKKNIPTEGPNLIILKPSI